jgi:hypothetical protein
MPAAITCRGCISQDTKKPAAAATLASGKALTPLGAAEGHAHHGCLPRVDARQTAVGSAGRVSRSGQQVGSAGRVSSVGRAVNGGSNCVSQACVDATCTQVRNGASCAPADVVDSGVRMVLKAALEGPPRVVMLDAVRGEALNLAWIAIALVRAEWHMLAGQSYRCPWAQSAPRTAPGPGSGLSFRAWRAGRVCRTPAARPRSAQRRSKALADRDLLASFTNLFTLSACCVDVS